jgi:hypothetical protein
MRAESVIRGLHAARGLLLAAAAFVTALTGLVVALTQRQARPVAWPEGAGQAR